METFAKSNIFVSIIIPVYNVEQYITRCFWSVISQTYRNYECIFVDDCGQDDSVKILQNLIDQYTGDIPIKFIHHIKNQGLSAARNSAMDIAGGDYILFVDSDDFIFPDSLEKLITPLRNEVYDVVAGRSLIPRGKNFVLSRMGNPDERNPIAYYYEGLSFLMGIGGTACNHLYRKAFLQSYKIKFYEGILFEDIIFNAEFFCKNPKVLEIDQISYFYDIRECSITTTRSKKKFDNEIAGVKILEDIMLENHLQNDMSANLLICQRYFRLLIIAKDYDSECFNEAFEVVWKRGWKKSEFQALKLKHKLLYIKLLMPKKIAYIYTKCFVWFYRKFIWEIG